MKRPLLLLLILLTTQAIHAQFESSKTYFNTSLTGLDLSYNKDQKIRINADATLGHFIADDWMLYAQATYEHRKHQDHFGVGVGTRYYIEQNGLYLNLGVRLDHGNTTSKKTNNILLTPELGYAYFINRHVTIEPAVYYDMSINDYNNSSRLGLRLGFGMYF